MPEEKKKTVKKVNLKFVLSVLLLVVVIVVIATSLRMNKDKNEEHTDETVETDNVNKQVLLKMGILSFWLVCLAIVLVGVMKMVELSGKY
jgi:ABC-type Fe3+ transport system permease subunit